MRFFECRGFNRVRAESFSEAALTFANRAARRVYGHRGYVRTCNETAHTFNGGSAEFSAFIGKSATGEPGATVGNNFNFTVSKS